MRFKLKHNDVIKTSNLEATFIIHLILMSSSSIIHFVRTILMAFFLNYIYLSLADLTDLNSVYHIKIKEKP